MASEKTWRRMQPAIDEARELIRARAPELRDVALHGIRTSRDSMLARSVVALAFMDVVKAEFDRGDPPMT